MKYFLISLMGLMVMGINAVHPELEPYLEFCSQERLASCEKKLGIAIDPDIMLTPEAKEFVQQCCNESS